MISIVIPTFNNSVKIQNAINSLLNQNISDLEIIIIDDSSNDKTQQILKSFHSKYIKYYKNDENIGTTLSRIKGIRLCSNQYIGFLDDDDIMLDNVLNKKINLIKSKNYDFIFCNYIVNNSVKNSITTKKLNIYEKNFKKHILLSPGPFLQCCLFKKDFILSSLVCFDKNAEPSEDWDFFISISKKTLKIKHLNLVGFQWNFSQKSQSYNYKNEMLALQYITKKHFYYMKKHSKKGLSLQYRKIGSMLYSFKEYRGAKKYFKYSFCLRWYSIKNIILFPIQYLPNTPYHFLMTKYVKKIV